MKISVEVCIAALQYALLFELMAAEQTLHWFADKDNTMMQTAIIPKEIEARKENRWLAIPLFEAGCCMGTTIALLKCP